MIVFSQLEAADVDRSVAKQAEFFSERGEGLEWKVYAHDQPSNLSAALAAHGFIADELETLMVLDLGADEVSAEIAADVNVRTVGSRQELATYVAVSASAFGDSSKSSPADFDARLFEEGADMVASIAYVDAKPAAAGRLELPHGRSFASLWGGGTHPSFRGRGIYRMLVAERARMARDRGYKYLTVDARESSRPILERLNFSAATTVLAWNLKYA